VSSSKQEIGARVDELGQMLEGDEFVVAVGRLADELGADERLVLQDVLLERAAEDEDLRRAARRRFAEKGWTRRALARIEGIWRDDRADALAAAIQAGPGGVETLARELESLRQDRGRAALVLDELSRHRDRRVRSWVPGTAAEILEDGSTRLVLSMTRDRDPEVRDAAVSALIGLGPEASRPVLPDLRRRLHSRSPAERIAAIQFLGRAGDLTALAVLDERAVSAELPEERGAAEQAAESLRVGSA
jgi:HEAT repeats